jgi:hypothetical protein
MSDSTTVTTDRRQRRPPWRLPRRSQAVGQLGWGLGDQALSSLTNFALNLLVARQVGVDQLGVFSLVFATYLLALGVSRSLNSDALAVRYRAADQPAWREATARAAGGALGLGLVAGAACALAGWVAGGLLGQALLVLGLWLPGLLLQDVWRFAFVARGRSAQAFLNDLVWTLVLAAALAVLLAGGGGSVLAFELAWAGAAAVAAAAGIAQARLLPWPPNPLGWWRRHRDLNLRYLGEFLTIGAVSQLNSYGISAVAGLAAVGALRAGEILVGPVYVLFMGGNMIAVAEGARLASRSVARVGRLGLLVSAGMSACAVAWGTVLVLAPDSVGTRVLGPTWYAAAAVLVPYVLVTIGLTASAGPQTGLRALGAARRGLRARLVAAPLLLAGAVGGAALAGAAGAAWGMAAGYWAAAAVWWWQFRLALGEHRP